MKFLNLKWISQEVETIVTCKINFLIDIDKTQKDNLLAEYSTPEKEGEPFF